MSRRHNSPPWIDRSNLSERADSEADWRGKMEREEPADKMSAADLDKLRRHYFNEWQEEDEHRMGMIVWGALAGGAVIAFMSWLWCVL